MQRFTSQKKMKILTFSTRGQNSLNGVLDETTTANTPGRSSRAHARLCKFTSGSRPSSSRRPILRSLMCYPSRFPELPMGFECFVGRDRFTVIKPFIPLDVRSVTSMNVVWFESQ